MSVLLLWSLWVFIGFAFVALLVSAYQGYFEEEGKDIPVGIKGYGVSGD